MSAQSSAGFRCSQGIASQPSYASPIVLRTTTTKPLRSQSKRNPPAVWSRRFKWPTESRNDGAAAPDSLPKNPIARLVFVKTAQGYLPSIPLALQKLTFACAEFVAKITGMEKQWQVYFS